MLRHIGFALYAACVDFMLVLANTFGITYRDANAMLFFVLWPTVTAILAVIVFKQWRELKRLRH